jgi:hypothetical protein
MTTTTTTTTTTEAAAATTTRPESSSELYRPRDRRLSAELVSTSAYKGCHVVSVTDPYGLILDFLNRLKKDSILYVSVRRKGSGCRPVFPP